MTDFSEGNILDHIQYPDDLRQLPPDKLGQVCSELRQYIIDVLSENPGHLGASLGTVELTVALHYVFNTPFDRIVLDIVCFLYENLQSIHTRMKKTWRLSGNLPFPSRCVPLPT